MEEKLAFLKEEWFMWLSLVIFAPVGVFLMWKYNEKLKQNTKILLTIAFFVLFVFIWIPSCVGIQINSNNQKIEQLASENKQVAQEVEKKITTLGDPKAVTLDKSSSVKTAKTAYNSLTNEQKGMVSYETLKILVIADDNITTLENKAKDEKAAADKAAAEKAAADKAAAEKAAADKAAADKVVADQAAADQAAAKAAATEQASAQKTATSETQSATVYTTDSGSKYHVTGCQYLSKSKIPISLEKAISSGLTPCSKCNPPQ